MSSSTTIIIIAVVSIIIVMLGLFGFFVLMMVRSHRKIEAEQRQRIEQMQNFSEKLQAAREDEQKQIARELHDELGGALTGLKYDLHWLGDHAAMNAEAKKRHQAMRALVDQTTKTVQRISSQLRPKILDSVGLAAAVEWHTREFAKRTQIETKLHQNGDLPPIGEAATTGIYRIIQEAMTNVARHANATALDVALRVTADSLEVEIADNGKGVEPAQLVHPDSLGIMSMQERARTLGGEIKIASDGPGTGTRVTLRVFLKHPQETGPEGERP